MTAQPVTVVLMGPPTPFARMRIAARSGAHFVPAPQRNAMAALRIEAANTMLQCGAAVLDEPLQLELLAEMPIPASWSKKKRNAAILGLVRPTGRPDLDNVYKLMADAFNGVVFRDDALIVTMRCRKIYGLQPKLVITISPIGSPIPVAAEAPDDIASLVDRAAAAAQPSLKLGAAA